jgi:hypothetical protein
MPITIKQLQSDPAFLSLPDAEKLKGLNEVLPGFSDLPADEQKKALVDFSSSSKPSLAIQPPAELPWYKKAGKAVMDVAPVGGMMVGGALGLPPSLATGPFAPVAEVGAIAAGGATGEMIRRQGYSMMGLDEPQTFASQVGAGVEGAKDAAMAAMLPGAAIAGANKVYAPFAEDISIGAKLLIDRATELNLPIPAKAFLGNLATRGLQWMGEVLLPGKLLSEHYKGKVQEKLSQLRSTTIGDSTGTQAFFRGGNVAEEAALARPSLKTGVKEAYSEAREMLPGGAMKIAETRKVLGALSQNPKVMKDTKMSAWVNAWLEKTAPKKGDPYGVMKFEDMPSLYSQINTSLNKLSEGGKGLFDALNKDLKTWDAEQGAAIAQKFTDARGKAKDQFGFNATFRVFQRATKRTDTGDEVFMPSVARAELARQRDQIVRSYGEDSVKMIEEYLSLTEAAARGASKLQIPGNPLDIVLGGGSLYGKSPLMLVVPYGTSFAVTHSLTASKGLMKRWLLNTKQIKAPPSLMKAAGMGMMYGMQDDPTQGGAIPLRQE